MTSGVLPDEAYQIHAARLSCGETVKVRMACPEDVGRIQAYLRTLSPASRRNRFLGALNELPANELYRMTRTDRGNHPALIAENVVDGASTMIGELRYAVSSDGLNCEFAVSVA